MIKTSTWQSADNYDRTKEYLAPRGISAQMAETMRLGIEISREGITQ